MRYGVWGVLVLVGVLLVFSGAVSCMADRVEAGSESLVSMLDAPMLFAKRHSYQGIHIYDTYYQWHPGGGIYVLENPGAPAGERKVRAVIDAKTPETLGVGVYSDPELSWDARRVLFCFKGSKEGNTFVYEIGIDGTGLRQLTDSEECVASCGRHVSHHDVGPAYLPDGRILYGRWEYVDKTALTQQTLWTIYPDGSNETAFFANNLVRPEAFLDARPVPGSVNLVASSLTRHNLTPRGSVGIVDVHISKNDPAAIANFDHAEDPTVDTGDSCEPWPLSKDVLMFSGRGKGAKRNAIEMMSRDDAVIRG